MSQPRLVKSLASVVSENEDWLVKRVLDYAKRRDYVKYTSTLEEAWRLSISGLSDALMQSLKAHPDIPELSPDENLRDDPATAFGITESSLHRSRGVTLKMFLGLMKYYRQSYLDLVAEMMTDGPDVNWCNSYVNRFFDRIELAFCSEWADLDRDDVLSQIREASRRTVNDKNKYLTIFESLRSPVILLNADNKVDNMNQAAASLFGNHGAPGLLYYGGARESFELQWLAKELKVLSHRNDDKWMFEKNIDTSDGTMSYEVKLFKMVDVSDKFRGTAVVLDDVTERKRYEKSLAYLATHDPLTGLSNRRLLEDALKRAAARARRGVWSCLLFIDVDNFKQINDHLGHQAGDRVLLGLRRVLARSTRGADMVARMGGDEFAVLLEGVDSNDATVVADRMRLAFKKSKAALHSYGISLSIGIVSVDGTKSARELLSAADAAMYRAKELGRDRIVTEV